jgi:hypothetical protein
LCLGGDLPTECVGFMGLPGNHDLTSDTPGFARLAEAVHSYLARFEEGMAPGRTCFIPAFVDASGAESPHFGEISSPFRNGPWYGFRVDDPSEFSIELVRVGVEEGEMWTPPPYPGLAMRVGDIWVEYWGRRNTLPGN